MKNYFKEYENAVDQLNTILATFGGQIPNCLEKTNARWAVTNFHIDKEHYEEENKKFLIKGPSGSVICESEGEPEKIYILHFVELNFMIAHKTFDSAREHENKYASISHLNCLGRWQYKTAIRWKTKWEDTEDGSELTSFIYERYLLP